MKTIVNLLVNFAIIFTIITWMCVNAPITSQYQFAPNMIVANDNPEIKRWGTFNKNELSGWKLDCSYNVSYYINNNISLCVDGIGINAISGNNLSVNRIVLSNIEIGFVLRHSNNNFSLHDAIIDMKKSK